MASVPSTSLLAPGQGRQIIVVSPIAVGDQRVVEPPLRHAARVNCHQHDYFAPRIEGNGNALNAVRCCEAQLLHVGVR